MRVLRTESASSVRETGLNCLNPLHPTIRSILEGPGEVSHHQVACHFLSLPIAGPVRAVLRDVHLQGIEMQDANLSGARLEESVFRETFDVITAVAISRSGHYWAASGRRVEVRVWSLRLWRGPQVQRQKWEVIGSDMHLMVDDFSSRSCYILLEKRG